jgi:hypothetical protein
MNELRLLAGKAKRPPEMKRIFQGLSDSEHCFVFSIRILAVQYCGRFTAELISGAEAQKRNAMCR